MNGLNKPHIYRVKLSSRVKRSLPGWPLLSSTLSLSPSTGLEVRRESGMLENPLSISSDGTTSDSSSDTVSPPGQPEEEEGNRYRSIRTRYLGHVTGYQPFRDQYFLIQSIPADSVPGAMSSLLLGNCSSASLSIHDNPHRGRKWTLVSLGEERNMPI